jgi:beta-1,4-mannosyl-glycoprotein beta-1,4-N-acetylglucosaminyltransferase
MPSRVFDAFLFRDELDLLEARLIELDSVAYRFVLVEAPVTFQGDPKPLYFRENQERFAPWKDRIVHVTADLSGYSDHWSRDHGSREAIRQGLGGLGDEDIFLLSDVDEIPMASAIARAPGHVLCMRSHPVAVNLIDPGWWTGTTACYGRQVRGSIQKIRDRRMSPDGGGPLKDAVGWPLIAGWHFTWLGGPAAMREKVRSIAHPEQIGHIDAESERMYKGRVNPACAGQRLLETVIDDSWPRFMQERRGPESWYWPGE